MSCEPLTEKNKGSTLICNFRRDHYMMRFCFVTRCSSSYVETVIADLSRHPYPDIIIMNSCLWDMTRSVTDEAYIWALASTLSLAVTMDLCMFVAESCGPDDIHYQMLKHLPASALDSLLHILNDIWSSCNFPPGWQTSTVIPVLKPGKEDTDPCSYLSLIHI